MWWWVGRLGWRTDERTGGAPSLHACSPWRVDCQPPSLEVKEASKTNEVSLSVFPYIHSRPLHLLVIYSTFHVSVWLFSRSPFYPPSLPLSVFLFLSTRFPAVLQKKKKRVCNGPYQCEHCWQIGLKLKGHKESQDREKGLLIFILY